AENNDNTPEKCYELVTDSLVKSALEKDKGEDAELISFEVKPFTKAGDNYLCVIAEVLIKYRLDDSEYDVSYVAKLNPLRPESSMDEVLEEMFGRETDILSIIIEGMNEQLEMLDLPPIKAPKLFSWSLEKNNEGFLAENLREEGFKMFDRRKGMDLNHCTLEDWNDINHLAYQTFDKLMVSEVENTCDYLKNAGPQYEKCEKWLTDHNDIPVDIRFVDFQNSKKASPALDFNYFLYSSINGDLRLAERDTMIGIYYDAFQEVFEKSGKPVPFSIPELMEELDNNKIHAMCCAILLVPSAIADKDELFDMDKYKDDDMEECVKLTKENYRKY
ncbi:hypothetical protein Anas_12427, partial [Armadillidium nasatum]